MVHEHWIFVITPAGTGTVHYISDMWLQKNKIVFSLFCAGFVYKKMNILVQSQTQGLRHKTGWAKQNNVVYASFGKRVVLHSLNTVA